MDKQVLTLEIAMKYPKAKISEYSFSGKKVSDYENIKATLEIKTLYWGGGIMDSHLKNCKLQLRKLESLTEKEKDFIKENCFYSSFRESVLDWNDLDELLRNYIKPRFVTKFIDYLRSINIDIDNLIQSGIAEEVR